MKKVFALLLVLAMVLGAVGCKTEKKEPEVSIGFVTDLGGINDKSFNQTSFEGIKVFANEIGLNMDHVEFLQSSTESDYVPNLSAFADREIDLIVAAGFLFADAMAVVAEKYPNQKMLIIDVDWLEFIVSDPANLANTQQAVFAEHEGSFLVGVVAGLAAKEKGRDKVGFVIGMESVVMAKFYAGFEAGVHAVYPECEIMYDNANDFQRPEIGKTLAQKHYNAGAYIVYHAAGLTGDGVIQEAAERRKNGEDVWAIGVDKDQFEYGIYNGTDSSVLTSMLKRVDVASYNACMQVFKGEFKGGVVVYDLKADGVGIPKENPSFKFFNTDFDAELKPFIEKIKDGSLVVPKLSPTGRGS